MLRNLYITCSSFSGSTLLSLVLNTHPAMTTVGHATGWPYPEGEAFLCSCGAALPACPFWSRMAQTFAAAGLPFDFRSFGTDYELVRNERLNRYLTSQLPRCPSTPLERLRDRIVGRVPSFRAALSRQDRANLALIEATLAYGGAKVYVENSHSPYRLRRLGTLSRLEVSPLHLIRDIRGVVNSHMTNHGWDASTATGVWLKEQLNIVRILGEFERKITIHYEDLCDDTDATLAQIHQFAGVEARAFSGDFGLVEHHVLGNDMRHGITKITNSAKWKDQLSADDLRAITIKCKAFQSTYPQNPLSAALDRYLEG